MARSMLSECNVSQSFWTEAINTACCYSNRLYCHPMMEKTSYVLNGRKPNIAYFWVFGCKCYILKKGTRLSKFDKKCDEGFLLGYSTTSKAYRVWNLASGTLEEVHDVEFDVIGDISIGVQTRSRLASFCEHFSFVSSIETKKIDEALLDVDWVNAMHEELNNLTRN